MGSVELTLGIVLLVLFAGLAAGWVDAVVGGGGLLQLPALLLIPEITPVQALATNKLGSIFGTSTSALTYFKRVSPDLKTAVPMACVALVGSFGGAIVALQLPQNVFKPIIVGALIVVALFTAFRPSIGTLTALKHRGKKHYGLAILIGVVIGFYDGLIGPGTGSFLVIALVSVLGYSFLQSSAKAKLINVATNFGALILFIPNGAVLWVLGLILGAGNLVGGYLGSRMAIARGNTFIRVVFLVVVFALIVKLSWDIVAEAKPLAT